MGKFIIKVTYLEGEHAEREYFMIKGGYVTDHPESVSDDSAYTEKACKMICTKYANNNEREVRMETWKRECREKDGKTNSKYRIYYPCKYEPYEIGKLEAIEEAEEIPAETEPAQEEEIKHSVMTAKEMEDLYVRYDLDKKTWKMLYEMACHNLIDYETWVEFDDKCRGYTFKDEEETMVINDYEHQDVVYVRDKNGVLVRA